MRGNLDHFPEGKIQAAQAVLLIWHDVAEKQTGSVNAWYTLEHHIERLNVTGFLSATRWQRTSGTTGTFLCLYEVASPDVFTSDAYLSRLKEPTSWTQAVMPKFRQMYRSCTRVAYVRQKHRASYSVLLADADRGNIPPIQAVENIAALDETASVLLLITLEDTQPLKGATNESILRQEKDKKIEWTLLVETSRPEYFDPIMNEIRKESFGFSLFGTYEKIFCAEHV